MTKPRTVPLRELDAYEFSWLPLYADELFALCGVLGNEAGMAMLRLRYYALTQVPRCTLPDDDEVLARVSGLGATWPTYRGAIRDLLTPVDGRLRDRTLTARFVEQAIRFDVSQARSSAGRTGGEHSGASRRGKHPGQQPGSNRPTKIGPLLDPLISSVVSGTAFNSLEQGQATGEATGEANGSPTAERVVGATTDWRQLVDPRRAESERRRAEEVPGAAPDASDAKGSDS